MSTKIEIFTQKANIIHGDKYDYSLSEYINAHTKIIIICPIHGQFHQEPSDHIHKKSGCPICAKQSRIITNRIKYGTDHPRQNKEIQEKQKQTNLERYGVEYPIQNLQIYQKYKQSLLNKHGVEHTSYIPETIQKRKDTIFNRYVTHPIHSPQSKDKAKSSNKNNHNSVLNTQHHIIESIKLLENKEWLFNLYVDNGQSSIEISKTLKCNPQTVLNYIHKHEIPITYNYIYNYSKISIMWLDQIAKQERLYIQHALNEGEYTIPTTKYRADGYCKETNTIYEFHGDKFHGNLNIFKEDDQCHPFTEETALELNQKTIQREQLIKSMGYKLVVMWENDFKKLFI